jgi:hypothetical protein
VSACPVLDIGQEGLLTVFSVWHLLHEDEHRLRVARIQILLLGCGAAGRLECAIAASKEENDDIGRPNTTKAHLLRRRGRGTKVLGANELASERLHRSGGRVPKAFITRDDRTDEDAHDPQILAQNSQLPGDELDEAVAAFASNGIVGDSLSLGFAGLKDLGDKAMPTLSAFEERFLHGSSSVDLAVQGSAP